MVIEYCDLASYICTCDIFSSLKTTDKHLCSIFGYLVSMSVRVLEANAIGLLFCMRAAPNPYLLASVCISTGFV